MPMTTHQALAEKAAAATRAHLRRISECSHGAPATSLMDCRACESRVCYECHRRRPYAEVVSYDLTEADRAGVCERCQ
jgi:hypothetical protein